MRTLFGMLLAASCAAGCLSTARPKPAPVEPDPIVGELGCAPPMTILDALYRAPSQTPTRCE